MLLRESSVAASCPWHQQRALAGQELLSITGQGASVDQQPPSVRLQPPFVNRNAAAHDFRLLSEGKTSEKEHPIPEEPPRLQLHSPTKSKRGNRSAPEPRCCGPAGPALDLDWFRLRDLF
jgi:hypothetical protein